MSSVVDYHETVGVGIITINRPDKLNALNQQVLDEWEGLLHELTLKQKQQVSLRGLLIRGAGEKAFIAGADIASMSQMQPAEAQAFCQQGQRVTQLLEDFPCPTLALVQGFALGGGCEMAMACDFILATDKARFGQPEVHLGLIAGFGGTQRLARLIGRSKAKEALYSGRMIKASEALSWGLIYQLVASSDQLELAALELLEKFQKSSPWAIFQTKRSLNQGIDLPLQQALDYEQKVFTEIFSSEDSQIGMQGFLKKEQPQFKGQ